MAPGRIKINPAYSTIDGSDFSFTFGQNGTGTGTRTLLGLGLLGIDLARRRKAG